jgi:hypothetical protein
MLATVVAALTALGALAWAASAARGAALNCGRAAAHRALLAAVAITGVWTAAAWWFGRFGWGAQIIAIAPAAVAYRLLRRGLEPITGPWAAFLARIRAVSPDDREEDRKS